MAEQTPDNPIYLDNAATSWPKPPAVIESVELAAKLGGSPGRAAHARAMEADRTLLAARRATADFLGVENPRHVAFLPSCTYAANTVINSLPSDARVLMSPFEHNSVTRPLARARLYGVTTDKIPATPEGYIDLDAATKMLYDASKSEQGPYTYVICQHANNVTGAIQPIEELTELAHESGAQIIVDGAQSAGHLLANLQELDVDAWFASGHKGLLGPRGVGILYVKPDFECYPLAVGGTGFGDEDGLDIENKRPDCFEAGTINLPAIVGMTSGMAFIAEEYRAMASKESALLSQLINGLSKIKGVKIIGPHDTDERASIVSIVADQLSPDTLAYQLDTIFGIETRAGIHCSPSTHDVMGTAKTGTVRISPSYATTPDEIEATLEAIEALLQRAE